MRTASVWGLTSLPLFHTRFSFPSFFLDIPTFPHSLIHFYVPTLYPSFPILHLSFYLCLALVVDVTDTGVNKLNPNSLQRSCLLMCERARRLHVCVCVRACVCVWFFPSFVVVASVASCCCFILHVYFNFFYGWPFHLESSLDFLSMEVRGALCASWIVLLLWVDLNICVLGHCLCDFVPYYRWNIKRHFCVGHPDILSFWSRLTVWWVGCRYPSPPPFTRLQWAVRVN